MRERKNRSRTLYSSLIIVKSLQFRGHRQIAEPRKYCLVCVIVFLWRVFSLFFFSHRLGIQVNSLHALLSVPLDCALIRAFRLKLSNAKNAIF